MEYKHQCRPVNPTYPIPEGLDKTTELVCKMIKLEQEFEKVKKQNETTLLLVEKISTIHKDFQSDHLLKIAALEQKVNSLEDENETLKKTLSINNDTIEIMSAEKTILENKLKETSDNALSNENKYKDTIKTLTESLQKLSQLTFISDPELRQDISQLILEVDELRAFKESVNHTVWSSDCHWKLLLKLQELCRNQ